ncbi:MAG: hypothetical protein ABI857_10205 [Acidobacteriota bacterium]
MRRWLTTFLMVFTLAGSMSAGISFHRQTDGMMKCCARAKGRDGSAQAQAAKLCCAINCADPAPTAPNSSISFFGSSHTIASFASTPTPMTAVGRTHTVSIPQRFDPPSRLSEPKYIRHHSLLI